MLKLLLYLKEKIFYLDLRFILSSISTFVGMWIIREEYNDIILKYFMFKILI